MDLEIKRGDRIGTGVSFHKTGGIKCSHTRTQALSDISKYCLNSDFYTKNYVHIESMVLQVTRIQPIVMTLYFEPY